MKVTTNKTHVEFIPEDSYDYFLLGRMSIAISEHNYDFNGIGKARTIKVFRITKEMIIDRISRIN